MRFRLFAACLAVLAVLLPLSTASAKEYIGSYDAVIDLSRDGSMLVTETIKANAEGQNIRRGIFRDFPLTFVDANGRKATVDFELIGVERDGEPEEWRQESISGGTRIYIGRSDVMLDHGEHTFQIVLRVVDESDRAGNLLAQEGMEGLQAFGVCGAIGIGFRETGSDDVLRRAGGIGNIVDPKHGVRAFKHRADAAQAALCAAVLVA